MNLGARIKQERERQKLTQEELAKRARLPGKQQTIQALEMRDSKRSEYASALCEALGINLQWALTGQGPKSTTPVGEVVPESSAKAFHPEDPAGDEEIRISEETVKFSGGRGHLVSYETATDREPATYRLSWFHKERINPTRAKRFRVVGNSMEPLLYSGDSILVNLEETQVREGFVYVFRHGDELKVKKLLPKSDGSLVLRSINRDDYPDDVVPAVNGHLLDNGGTVESIAMDLTATQAVSIQGAYTDGGGGSGNISMGGSATGGQQGTLATLAGSYAFGYSVGGQSYSGTISITSTGAVTGSDSGGCTYSGAVSPNTANSIFDVSFTSSCLSGTLSGIAFYPPGATRLTLAASNSSGALYALMTRSGG